ncbi:MAG: MFS transporter [Spirochaetia bacterium]
MSVPPLPEARAARRSVSLPAAARRITAVLFAAQCLGSAAFIAIATVGPILAVRLSAHESWAGIPSACTLLAGAGAAFLWGYLMDSLGRRGSLALGLGLGGLGAALSFFAVSRGSFILFAAGMVLIGVANAAANLSRFAAAEVHPPAMRGRAISYVVLGGTVGAIAGPLLIGPSGRAAVSSGYGELSGALAVSVLFLSAAAALVMAALRPDPKILGQQIAAEDPKAALPAEHQSGLAGMPRSPAAFAAVITMVFSQASMVAMMVITSFHMSRMNHGLGDISLVFSAHTIGMYAFSVLSGRLLDWWGRGPVILTGACAMVAACVSAPFVMGTFPLAVSLLLLGLGWNFCFVGGSAMLSDQLTPAVRARVQGFNDLLVGLAAAIGSLGSGVVSALAGYSSVGLSSAALALVPLFLVARLMRTQRRAAG